MIHSLTPYFKRLLLVSMLLLATTILHSHSFQTLSVQSPYGIQDTSQRKSIIHHCANFGQIHCTDHEAGGISGYTDAADLMQCFNTGDISGLQKTGGIAGYASGNAKDTSIITQCFNSGQIHGQSNSGGLVGYLNQHLSINKAYNIGNVDAVSYAGAIVGRRFSTSTRISDCFYDLQTCLKGGIENQDVIQSAEGKLTTQMLADSLSPVLNASQWKFSSNYYPRLSFLDTLPAVWGAVSPLMLQKNERIDSIASAFRMQQTPGLHWTVDDSTSIQISGDRAYILKEDSNRTLSIGDGTHIFKQIPLLHTYSPACRHIVLDDLQGNGKIDTLMVCNNEKILLPKPTYTRTHYIFLGWGFTSSSRPVFQSGDSARFNNDTTLYAIWSPDGKDSSHAVSIDNVSDLIAFREAVNNSKGVYKGIANASSGYKGIHFLLTADIDLDSLYKAGESWEPIGKSSSVSFKGCFYGGKHSISHLYIHAPAANYKGFFGYLDSALVEGVVLSTNDSIIGKQYCGGIAAYVNNLSTIRNCANHAYVEGASTHVGGICGYIGKSVIEDCFNTGYITGNEKVGGIVGYTNGNSSVYSAVRYCYNSGQIHAAKAAGGIAGNTYSYTRIEQVLHSGQIWADTLIGSIIGQKSQKSVVYAYGYYDRQISPVGGINNTDDSTIMGKGTMELCNGKLPLGFDSLYWQQTAGLYPQLHSADSSTASCIAVQPVFFASNNDISRIGIDFDLSGCDYIQWKSSSDSLRIQACKGNLLGQDSQIILYAINQQIIYKQIRILQLQQQKMCCIQLLANDSLNTKLLRYAYENSYFRFDTLPFQKTHQVFRGWSSNANGSADIAFGDSVLIMHDTSFYAIWSNDGLSAAYALSIDSLSDWMDFRDAVNDYTAGCYKGVCNYNSGYRGVYFSLNTSLNLHAVCDSLHSWIPVGKNTSCNFKGHFNGNGHTVDYLIIDSAALDYAGIFGCVDSAVISAIELGQHSSIRANNYVGGIAGCARRQSNIQGCANHAVIYGHGEYIGGITGYLSRSTIEECYNAANICGKAKVGGIVGYAGTASTGEGSTSASNSRIAYCYNSNAISGNDCTGGLIGFLNGNTSLEKAYNSGQLFGEQYTGSIIGRKYSSTPRVEKCFYDRQISTYRSINGKDVAPDAVGVSTLKMTGKALKDALDSIHWIYTENFYPRLSRLDSSASAWISVVPIFLEETECCDNVSHDFRLGNYDKLSWESSNPLSLRIEGSRACLLDSDTICLTAVYDQYAHKRYRIIQHFIPSDIHRIETETPLSIRVYPNPTDRHLFIQTKENSDQTIQTVSLYNVQGRLLLRQDVAAEKTGLDLSMLSSGTYFLHVQDGKGSTYNYRIIRK